ncbi:MAG: hypothetical protein AUI10_09565 [Actinobacteria bacterium 13_2_20CM_2_72_6]|nr:MAG: hypothetical protein AUI10_09565 [Actinobacteria bacterium 13_2_20CM_2_72_6]
MTRLRLNTVLRVGVRTLLVAGFAGGAWLFSSAAAHAAAPAGAPARTTQAVVDPTLRLLDQVLVPGTNTHSGSQRSGVVAVQGHHSARPAAAPVTRRPAPVRPASQAVSAERSHRPALAGPVALSRLISSAFDLVRPLSGMTERVSAPVTDLLSLATGAHYVVGRELPAVRTVARAVVPGGAGAVGAAPAAVDRAQRSTRIRPRAGTALPTVPAFGRPAVPGTHQVPYFPGRAPIPAFPDPGSTGISTTASGSQHDAGAYAVVPAPVAAGHLADLRRLRATQVAVRLLLADAPTFAPD